MTFEVCNYISSIELREHMLFARLSVDISVMLVWLRILFVASKFAIRTGVQQTNLH